MSIKKTGAPPVTVTPVKDYFATLKQSLGAPTEPAMIVKNPTGLSYDFSTSYASVPVYEPIPSSLFSAEQVMKPKPWGVPPKKVKPISTPLVMADTHVVCAKCGLSGGGTLCCVSYSVSVKKSTIRYDEAGRVIRAVACRQSAYT